MGTDKQPSTAIAHAMSNSDTLTNEFNEILDSETIFGDLVQGAGVPLLWLSHNGPVQTLTSSLWLWDLAVEYNSAIYVVGEPAAGAPAIIWKYSSNSWSKLATTGLDGTADEAFLFFIDSSGYLYISFLATDKLYRSTDDGVTFAAIASATQSSIGEFRSMTEDELGNLYIGFYDSNSPSDGTQIYLGKSTDNGATFSDITSNMNALSSSRHIHSVNYCPDRKTLFVCLGDRGVSESIQYSTDYGVTFTTWATGQVVSMAFDASYIYMYTELSGDNSIYRAANAGDTPARVYADPNPGSAGFSWNGHTDNYGNTFFIVGSSSNDQARCLVTTDNGNTWTDIYPAASAVADRQNFARVGRASYYAGGENGFFYGSGYQYRVYPGDHIFTINEGAGADPHVASTSAFNAIPDSGGIPESGSIKLLADYAASYAPGTDGLTIDKNGFDFTSTVTGAELFTMDLETEAHVDGSTPLAGAGNDKMSSYPTTASGDVDASSTQARGTLSMKVSTGGGLAYGRKDLVYSSIAPGDVAWISAWFYFDKATAPANTVGLMQIVNGANVSLRSSGYISIQLPQAGSVGRLDQASTAGAVSTPLQTWFKLKLAVKRSTSGVGNGFVRLWQDDKLILEALGIDTNAAGTGYSRAYFGSAEGNQSEVMYIDDMVCADFDPDKPTSPQLNGTGQTVVG